jgi:hypothetical protein
MVRTRKQQKESGETQSGESAASGSKRSRGADDDVASEELELIDPKRALKGKHGQAFKTLFQGLLDAVDESALPYFKTQVKRAGDALEDFVLMLSELFDQDSDAEEDSTAEERSGDDEEEEEEFEEEEETEDEDEENIDELLESDETEQEPESSLEEYDDDEVVMVGEDDDDDEEQEEGGSYEEEFSK